MTTHKQTHACTFVEYGRNLGPCSTCGMTAAEAIGKLSGDVIRRLLVDFINERPTFVAEMDGNEPGSAAWHHNNGNAAARRVLAERFEQANVDPGWVPTLQDLKPVPAGPRTASLVRQLHVLETITVGGTSYSSCKADGHISADLAADPCPTLKALNVTDPPPVPTEWDITQVQRAAASVITAAVMSGVKTPHQARDYAHNNGDDIRRLFERALRIAEPVPEFLDPVIDERLLARAIYTALGRVLFRLGISYSAGPLLKDAQAAARQINSGGVKMIDLLSEETRQTIIDAITIPGRYVQRDGEAVPGHQARAVAEALRKKAV